MPHTVIMRIDVDTVEEGAYILQAFHHMLSALRYSKNVVGQQISNKSLSLTKTIQFQCQSCGTEMIVEDRPFLTCISCGNLVSIS